MAEGSAGNVSQTEVESMVELLFKGRRYEVVEANLPALLGTFPQSSCLLSIFGAILFLRGQSEQAGQILQRAVNTGDDIGSNVRSLVSSLVHIGRVNEAIKIVQAIVSQVNDNADIYYALGAALSAGGHVDAAIESFKLSVKINPEKADPYCDWGNLLIGSGRLEAALALYELAEKFTDANEGLLRNKATTYQLMGRQQEAVVALEEAHKLAPGNNDTHAQLLFRKRYVCDWSDFPEPAVVEKLGLEEDLQPVQPFTLLSLDDSEARQAARASIYARHKFAANDGGVLSRVDAKEKIRVGYFSADFHAHATYILISGLLRTHDKDAFEVHCFSYGSKKDEHTRREIEQNGCFFHDIHGVSNGEVIALARQVGLDIACDLKGYTAHTRTDLFASRLAPVQINYLAYPGPLCADFIDYIIADEVVYPLSGVPQESEAVIHLPHSYQPNDNERSIGASELTREQAGLPVKGLVLCCFNNNYKISPVEFDIWMRGLKRSSDSVLWLLADNDAVKANLRREAECRGVDPDRLVFAPRVGPDQHLARHQLADLFVDTFNVNAHTTAADALWAGLPVLTKKGAQFASRVAASLLTAMGLEELIASSIHEYEELLVGLLTKPERLVELRGKTQKARVESPLFNSALYTKALEKAFVEVCRRSVASEAPSYLKVQP